MKVLIADDEPGTRLLLTTTLERLGHACVAAEDGDQAWERFLEEEPAMVVTDWQMPGLDGTEIARRIRERKLIAADRVTAMHRRLHADARHDPLTGIGNRLRHAEDLEAVCGRVARYGHAYCVAIADVDHFKAYNDAHGHRRGDDVLRAVASSLRDTVRTGDTVYRYGGEEFVVLLPEQTLAGAEQAAERLRAAVEALALPHPGGGSITVSIGVAGLGDGTCAPDALFETADQALYAAKEDGRNRVHAKTVAATGDRRVRVAIADDDESVRLTLGSMLANADGLELVGEAADAPTAISLAATRRPDVVVLDFAMPGGGGLRAATEIRDACPTARIVALSADSSPAAQLDMSRAGAVGYLVKGAPPDEIERAIRSAARW
jgi:diguanylate cyclase (GGDEF)-like protein